MWTPELSDTARPRYRAIADSLARDIDAGRVEPGARLPAMRPLADELGVTVGTVLRAYDLAERRGLITRHVGRGTFVREARPGSHGVRGTDDVVVDLSRNEPVHVPVGRYLQRTLAELGEDRDIEGLLEYGLSQGTQRHREIVARWIRRRGSPADAGNMVLTSGAQQALTIVLGALTREGDGLFVEALTYPGIKSLARMFGLRLHPVEIDADGLIPDAFRAACETGAGRLLYCMPNVHNPTTASLAPGRRIEIAAIAEAAGVLIVEDNVYPAVTGEDCGPLSGIAPEGTIHITSMSKTVAPGLRVGAIVSPGRLLADLAAAAQTTSWMPPPLMTELACRWIEDGTAEDITGQRDRATRRLHAIAGECLGGLDYRHEPHNPHIWLALSAGWTGAEFATTLAARQVRVSPAEDFAIEPARAPAAVRICLAEMDEARLRGALGVIAETAARRPSPAGFNM